MAELCPCGTQTAYAQCCGPLHRGRLVADTPTALMRSRYCAYVRKKVDYLIATLDPAHDDRTLPEAELRAHLRESCRTVRLMGLSVLDAMTHGDTGEVLFHAKRFVSGQNRSFLERSIFRLRAEGWRYRDGELYLASTVPSGITLLSFREHFAGVG